MRLLPRARLLAMALLAVSAAVRPLAAGVITVNPDTRTVETSRFVVQFDFSHHEEVRGLIFKDWNPYISIAAYEGVSAEFWGQTLRGLDSLGFIQPSEQISSDFEVFSNDSVTAVIRLTSVAPDQPFVTTIYRFFADEPVIEVERLFGFGDSPQDGEYQGYLPRIPFINTYRAIRYRDSAGELQQRVYAFQGVRTDDWDGHWLQQVGINGTYGVAIASVFDANLPLTHGFVRGYGPNSFTGWAAPLSAPGSHTHDETLHEWLYFSRDVDDTRSLDSLYTLHASGVLGAPAPRAGAALALSAAPNPARGTTRIAWTLPVAGAARLALYDVSGRRIALLHDGAASAGAHASAWDGRDANGSAVTPGVYLARLQAAGLTRTVRLVRVN